MRKRAGLTKKESARRSGFGYEQIWNWENGLKIPRPKNLRKYIDFLEVASKENRDLNSMYIILEQAQLDCERGHFQEAKKKVLDWVSKQALSEKEEGKCSPSVQEEKKCS